MQMAHFLWAFLKAFITTMKQFKEELLDGFEYKDQMDYLHSLKKPPKMDPNKFLLKLRSANGMVKQFPDAPEPTKTAGLSADELERVYYKVMPKKWQDNFDNANLRVSTASIGEIKSYMQRQAVKDPFVPKNNNNNDGNSNTGNSNSRSGN